MASRGDEDSRPFTTVINDKHKRREQKAKTEAKVARRATRLHNPAQPQPQSQQQSQQPPQQQRASTARPQQNVVRATKPEAAQQVLPRRLIARPMIVLDIKAFLLSRHRNSGFTARDLDSSRELFYRADVVVDALHELHDTGILQYDEWSAKYRVNPVLLASSASSSSPAPASASASAQ